MSSTLYSATSRNILRRFNDGLLLEKDIREKPEINKTIDQLLAGPVIQQAYGFPPIAKDNGMTYLSFCPSSLAAPDRPSQTLTFHADENRVPVITAIRSKLRSILARCPVEIFDAPVRQLEPLLQAATLQVPDEYKSSYPIPPISEFTQAYPIKVSIYDVYSQQSRIYKQIVKMSPNNKHDLDFSDVEKFTWLSPNNQEKAQRLLSSKPPPGHYTITQDDITMSESIAKLLFLRFTGWLGTPEACGQAMGDFYRTGQIKTSPRSFNIPEWSPPIKIDRLLVNFLGKEALGRDLTFKRPFSWGRKLGMQKQSRITIPTKNQAYAYHLLNVIRTAFRCGYGVETGWALLCIAADICAT